MSRSARAFLAAAAVAVMVSPALAQTNSHATSNKVKYKNTGAQPANGRSGSATLQLRALLAKDASTQIEASTGDLEAGTSAGNISKTQVKVLLVGSTPAVNYNNLHAGGYWTATYNGLSRGTQVQLQANVDGIDYKRTDVITTTASVLLRPDIAVRSVNGPAQAPPHTAVTFTAPISELNGDVGARANCVLSINGTSVDEADGIWVDAGGTVSCQFTHSFDSPGTYTVGVAAANVNPGDWDLSNNSASASITITQPGQPIANGFMSAAEYDVQNQGEGESVNSSYPYNYSSHYAASYSYAYMSGWDSGIPAGQLQRIDVTLSANSMTNHTASLTPSASRTYDDGDNYSFCASYSQDTWDGSHYVSEGDYASMCTYGSRSGGWGSANYYYERVTGDVTYYGNDTYCGYYGCNSYAWNYDSMYGNGASYGWTAGSSVRLQVDFVDSNGSSHTADHAATLQDYSQYVNYSQPEVCYADYYYGGSYCYSNSSSGQYFAGGVSWP